MASRALFSRGMVACASAPRRQRGGLRRLRHAAGCLSVAAALLASAGGAQAQIVVERFAIATGVEAREPVGEATVFPADVGRLYFFTAIRGGATGDEVHHVWIYDGREVANVPLAVQGPRWRTWSSKTIPSSWAGDWTVEVRDAAGRVLAATACRVE